MSLPITIGTADQDEPGPHPSALLLGGRSPSGRFIVVPAGKRTTEEWITARATINLEEVA